MKLSSEPSKRIRGRMSIKNQNLKNLNRVRGALYGVAVGDALGAPLEFLSADEIEARHGRVREMIGGGWLFLKPGEVTDDTQMTLCVARGIVKNPANPIHEIRKNFSEWFEEGPVDVGNQCRLVLTCARQYGWDEAMDTALARLGDRIDGNGALMRTIYPPLYYGLGHTSKTAEIAQITHPGKVSTELCVEYGDLVARYILAGLQSGKECLRFERRACPTGYVRDSYNVALECFSDTYSFEDGLITAVNRGGDADTIGAIFGGIAGAYYGYDAIPQRWLSCLDEDLCTELAQLANIAYDA